MFAKWEKMVYNTNMWKTVDNYGENSLKLWITPEISQNSEPLNLNFKTLAIPAPILRGNG